MKVAVALLTCDRAEYTARTVETFLEQNPDRSRFVLVHADDGSADNTNLAIAQAAGFETVIRAPQRFGWRVTRRRLLERAAKRANWILFLENDIDSLRPFPWALFDCVRARSDIYCLRLYGRFKDGAKTEPCLDTHKRMGHRPVDWRPFRDAPEPSQIGQIHWSAQPSVTRAEELLDLHRSGYESPYFTVRVKKNVTGHFGSVRTAPLARLEWAC